MCEAVGHPVVRLVRTRIGPLRDGSLQAGHVARAHAGRGARAYEAASATSPRADRDADNSPDATGPRANLLHP